MTFLLKSVVYELQPELRLPNSCCTHDDGQRTRHQSTAECLVKFRYTRFMSHTGKDRGFWIWYPVAPS